MICTIWNSEKQSIAMKFHLPNENLVKGLTWF